jgi:hypothetical protein
MQVLRSLLSKAFTRLKELALHAMSIAAIVDVRAEHARWM